VILAILAGLAGTLFHPAANALLPAHYPANPGLAIGLLGMGSGLGFFTGPQFAGWRAKTAAWNFAGISQWQKPCVELGLAGLLFSIPFILIAREAPGARRTTRPPMPPPLRRKIILLACVLGWRDFAGVAAMTLASLYLQRACGRDEQAAGLIIGLMMFLSFIVNPLSVFLTPGKRRLPALTLFLIAGGIMSATVPHFPIAMALIPLCAFQTFQLGSYALSDSAMLERVPPDLRGRACGIFLTIAGTLGALSPWWMGWWIDRLGPAASHPVGYDLPFATLALMMIAAALSPLILHRLGPATGQVSPLQEITPETMETVL
jgi:MFS family permease